MNRIILLGPPGSGKGTQAAHITAAKGITTIATGNMFREAMRNETPVGLEAKQYMDAGELVPDDVVTRMVSERLSQPDCQSGYILDGFPRTVPQADALAQFAAIDLVLEIRCPDQVIIDRLSGRRVHPGSGRIYHTQHLPPKVAGVDDETGEPLVQRDDDLPATIAKRLEVYARQTEALIDHYQRLDNGPRFASVDGNQATAVVTAEVMAALG